MIRVLLAKTDSGARGGDPSAPGALPVCPIGISYAWEFLAAP